MAGSPLHSLGPDGMPLSRKSEMIAANTLVSGTRDRLRLGRQGVIDKEANNEETEFDFLNGPAPHKTKHKLERFYAAKTI